ncbi:MAG: hypothetical protein R3F61_32165 [Myxococcota bacterium]
MDRWLRLPSGPHRSWRLHGIHEGIAWLTSHEPDPYGRATRVVAWNLAAGERLFESDALAIGHPAVRLCGGTTLVSESPRRASEPTTHAFDSSGLLWRDEGAVVAGSDELAVLARRGELCFVDFATGRRPTLPGLGSSVFEAGHSAVCGRTFKAIDDGRMRTVTVGSDAVDERYAPLMHRDERIRSTTTDFVRLHTTTRGPSVETHLEWRRSFHTLPGHLRQLTGNAKHLLLATHDPREGLLLTVLSETGVVTRVRVDGPILATAADPLAVAAVWTTGAAWHTDRTTIVSLPPSLQSELDEAGIALWDGFAVVCGQAGVLAPLARGTVAAARPGDAPLELGDPDPRAVAAAGRPEDWPPSRVLSAESRVDVAMLHEPVARTERSEDARVRYEANGVCFAVTGWGPPESRDPHLYAFAHDGRDGTWCLYAHPGLEVTPVVRVEGERIEVAADSVDAFLRQQLDGDGLDAAPRSSEPERLPAWFVGTYVFPFRTGDLPERVAHERAQLRAFLEGDDGAGHRLLRFYDEQHWAYAADNLRRILASGR